MAVNSKSSLIDYCLRDLGYPLIQINVTDEQIEDRIDQALEYFREYHYDGIERVLLKHQLTQENLDTKEIHLDDSLIYGVTKIIPYSGGFSGNNMFNLEYQIRVEDLYNLLDADLINYELTQQHLTLLNNLLVGENPFRYNRILNVIHLDMNLKYRYEVGDFILVECYRVLDPNEVSEVWANQWLKNYTVALIKKQWATNVKFFGGMQLPGGITVDGDSMYSEAVSEISELEDWLQTTSSPLFFTMG